MKSEEQTYEVDWVEAERILVCQLASLGGQSRTTRDLNRRTIQRFITEVGDPRAPSTHRMVFDGRQFLQWMIQACRGRSAKYACGCLGVLSQYLRALVRTGLLKTDPLADFQVCHGYPNIKALVSVLQSPDPEVALAVSPREPLPAGPLLTHIQSYVELQQSLGKKYRMHHLILIDFDRVLQAQAVSSLQAITPALVECWLHAMTCSLTVRINKTRCVRRFFQHLLSLKLLTHNPIPPARISEGRLPPKSFQPFIFTKEQVAAILAKAQELPQTNRFPLRAVSCYTAIALLYTLGLRSGEARRLRNCDLDFARQTLFIDQTKFHKSRYVPFGPKLGRCLQRFLEARRTVVQPLQDNDPLFVTLWRAPVSQGLFQVAFREILRALGITGIPGQCGPRLHDLRHTFAVHRLLRWYQEGVDVQSRLPALSTFMGHLDTRGTQVYLTITADLLKEANARFHRHFGCLFDEEVRG